MTDRELKKAITDAGGSGQIYMDDGSGLYLRCVSGKWYWSYNYRIPGDNARKRKGFGSYPAISLAQARKALSLFKADILQGNTPQAIREKADQKKVAGMTFRELAAEWFSVKIVLRSEGYQRQITSRLQNHILPYIGDEQITVLDKRKILIPCREQEKTSASMAHKILGHIREALAFAVSSGYLESNPAEGLIDAIKACPAKKHHPCVTDPVRLGQILRAIHAYTGGLEMTYCLRIMPYVFVRSGELRGAMWAEIDLDHGLWSVPADRMKADRPHVVPLARQIVSMMRELKDRQLIPSQYLFPGPGREGVISAEGMRQALFRCGVGKSEMDVHGFRGTASTLLREKGGFMFDTVEMQLAHKVGNTVERAYSHAELVERRRAMMQWWADYLDALRDGTVPPAPPHTK